MVALTDPTYRQTVGRAANALVGVGFTEQRIGDFEAKFSLFRSMIGMTEKTFPDNVFARLMFGEQSSIVAATNTAAGTFSKKKRGNVAFSPEDASAAAQLMNYCAGFSPSELSSYRSSVFDAGAIAFMMQQVPGNSALRAIDLARPMLDFAGRLAAVVAAANTLVGADVLHDRTMTFLNGLRACCDPKVGVMFSRSRDQSAQIPRFGDAQSNPDQPPWMWEPEVFRPGDRPGVGLGTVSDKPCELWALTIRDPRPDGHHARRGTLCWEESWENLVRWSVPDSPIPAGAPRTVDYGAIVDKHGDYSIYLLADEGATGRIRDILGVGLGATVPMEALYRLLAAATDARALSFACFTRRYRVRGGA